MEEFYNSLDDAISTISQQYGIRNLLSIQNFYNDNDYWPRLANFSFFHKLFDKHRYHFLYEIQGLSSQLHFGLASCFLLRKKISNQKGKPNIYNHRYTFMIESTIHSVYAYWNRVGLVLNTYLKNPKELKRVYFPAVVDQLIVDYPELLENQYYVWISEIRVESDKLNRNEFTHNNSLIMQDFLPEYYEGLNSIDLLAFPELLSRHNNHVVEEIYNLVDLIEILETITKDNLPK